ncbi:MAG: hypothetical protein H7346_15930 [Burkholderiaceae bacterium]|nr:hypothetical protein [Burkholderiaceae bacterium]
MGDADFKLEWERRAILGWSAANADFTGTFINIYGAKKYAIGNRSSRGAGRVSVRPVSGQQSVPRSDKLSD